METVLEKVCDEKHKGLDTRLENVELEVKNQSEKIGKVEDVLIMLTNMIDSSVKKDVFDKMIVISIFLIVVTLLLVIAGPDGLKLLLNVMERVS